MLDKLMDTILKGIATLNNVLQATVQICSNDSNLPAPWKKMVLSFCILFLAVFYNRTPIIHTRDAKRHQTPTSTAHAIICPFAPAMKRTINVNTPSGTEGVQAMHVSEDQYLCHECSILVLILLSNSINLHVLRKCCQSLSLKWWTHLKDKCSFYPRFLSVQTQIYKHTHLL